MNWSLRAPRLRSHLLGVPPATVCLSIGLALLIGVFPVYGCPTLLCAAAAVVLRLNLPAMQLVNVLTSPLQLILIEPFRRVGEKALGAHSLVPMGAGRLLATVGTIAAQSVTGWVCVCVPLAIVLYAVFALAGKRPRLRFAARTLGENPVQ